MPHHKQWCTCAACKFVLPQLALTSVADAAGEVLCMHALATLPVQALQLALLRRFTQQMLGVSSQAVLPEVLLRDAGETAAAAGNGSPGTDVDASHKVLRMLQELQAMAASSWPLELSIGEACAASPLCVTLCDSQQQGFNKLCTRAVPS